MSTYKAVVHGGRVVIENLKYEDGTELELVLVTGTDLDGDMDEDERKRLHAALDRGLAQMEAGDTIPAEEVFAEVRDILGLDQNG